MYLSKNSRSLFLKSSWLHSNVLKRDIRITVLQPQAKLPEDDPSKPPLRLNIPKDPEIPNPYDAQLKSWKVGNFAKSTERNANPRRESYVKFKDDELNLCVQGGRNEMKRESQSNRNVHKDRNPSKRGDHQNYSVKSNSSDFLTGTHSGRRENRTSNSKHFLKRKGNSEAGVIIKSKDGMKITKQSKAEHENDIMTIKITLEDPLCGDRNLNKGLSEMETEKNGLTDEKIRALAEAIISEITPKRRKATVQQNSEEEAYLVIINVSEKNVSDNVPVDVNALENNEKLNCASDTSSRNESGVNHLTSKTDVEVLDLAEDEFNCGHIQVRDLEFWNEMENIGYSEKTEPEATEIIEKETDRQESPLYRWGNYPMTVFKVEEPLKIKNEINNCSEKLETLENMIRCRQIKKLRNVLNRKENNCRSLASGMEEFKGSSLLSRERSENDFLHTRSRTYIPIGKKIQLDISSTRKKLDPKHKTMHHYKPRRLSSFMKRGIEQQFLKAGISSPIAYDLDRKLRIKNRVIRKSDVEKQIQGTGEEIWKNDKSMVVQPINFLKPLSKQITFIDEIPEYLKYPELKNSLISRLCFRPKNIKGSNSNMNCGNIIRTYRSSTVHDKDEKDNTPAKNNGTVNNREISMSKSISNSWDHVANEDQNGSLNITIHSKQGLLKRPNNTYFNNKLDKSQDELNSEFSHLKASNDVYLQDGNMIGNIVAPVQMKRVGNANNTTISLQEGSRDPVPPLIRNIATGETVVEDTVFHNRSTNNDCPTTGKNISLSSAIGFFDERYESDITDSRSISVSIRKFNKLQCGMAFPSASSVESGERGLFSDKKDLRTLDDKMALLRDTTAEVFEMNKNCLNASKFEADVAEAYPPLENLTEKKILDSKSYVGDSLLNAKKDVIINVVKNVSENTPKISDNIVNLANEGFAENKGTTSFDSLSMMKKVKEIVDLDLKNAEKIFVTSKAISPDPAVSQPLRQTATLPDIGTSEISMCESHPSASVSGLKLRETQLCASESSPTEERRDIVGCGEVKNDKNGNFKSVVTYNTNSEDLEPYEVKCATENQHCEFNSMVKFDQEILKIDENLINLLDVRKDEFKGDFAVYMDIPEASTIEKLNYTLNTSFGDSIIIYDENSKRWKVDYDLLNEKKKPQDPGKDPLPSFDTLNEEMSKREKSNEDPFPKQESNLEGSLGSDEDVNSPILIQPENSKIDSVAKSQAPEIEFKSDKIDNNCKSSLLEAYISNTICSDTKRRKTQKSYVVDKTDKKSLGRLWTSKNKELVKDVDAQEIRKKNSDLFDNVFVELKKSDLKMKSQEEDAAKPKQFDESKDVRANATDEPDASNRVKKPDGVERSPGQHYVSKNILQMSKNNVAEKAVRVGTNKVQTVKPNINMTARPPSVVTEINLNKSSDNSSTKNENSNSSDNKNHNKTKKPEEVGSTTFYKKFEKYKTPFGDPEYEEKPMKINSDLESNPNIKKLGSYSKTLVLREFSKPPENIESWLKDETDKMATLLLKVLQEAAEGNSKKRSATKIQQKGNPYEAIRKKQENVSGVLKSKIPVSKKKESDMKKSASQREIPIQVWRQSRPPTVVEVLKFTNDDGEKTDENSGKTTLSSDTKGGKGKDQFPVIEDELQVEVIAPESLLPKTPPTPRSETNMAFHVNNNVTEDIPGPDFLKKLSAFWGHLPDIGCQAIIFSMIWLFQMVKLGSSLLTLSNGSKIRNDPFGRLFVRYGPVVKLQGPLSGGVVLINRPEDIAVVLASEQSFPVRCVLDSVEKCRSRIRQKNFTIGITSSWNGFDLDIIRNALLDTSTTDCLHYFPALKNADTMFINKIRLIRNNQNQVSDDFITEIKKWSMEGLCTVIFGKSFGFLEKKSGHVHWVSESERLLRHLGEATDNICQCESNFQIWRFFDTPSMNGLNQAYRALDLIISKYVYQAEISLRRKRKAITKNKKQEEGSLTFLESILLKDHMTPEEVTSNIIDMLIMGANATTISMGFLLYNLAQNNRVQRRLFRELKELMPRKNSPLNYHQLHSLKYLQACLKESVRLNTPIPVLLRVLQNDVVLANYRIPAGTHIVMDSQTACMKEQYFDEPEKFKPERWLDQDLAHPFASIPFCNGPRASFIKRLTEIQLWTCAAKIVRNYQLEYHYGEIKGLRSTVSYPDQPLRLTFTERQE